MNVPQWIAWYQVLVGAGLLGTWTVLIVLGEVPEIEAGQRDIWFHIAAEGLTGALLVGAGLAAVLCRWPVGTPLLSMLALGALLYTTVNSPGYYAELNEWAAVAGFLVLALLTVVAGGTILRSALVRQRQA